MPSLPPYLPRRDADLDTWAGNFTTLLTAAPATYGQTAGTAVACAAAYASWHSAFLLVASPSTKTAATVAAKDAAKISMLATLRPVAVAISLNPAVSTGSKQAIGVNPRTSLPTPITPPSTYPILTVQAAANLQLYVRYRDSAASPSVKSKPYGVQSVQVAYVVATTPVTDVNLLSTQKASTKSPLILTFEPSDVGNQVYMAGRYLLRNGGYSGWGPIVNFTVAAAM